LHIKIQYFIPSNDKLQKYRIYIQFIYKKSRGWQFKTEITTTLAIIVRTMDQNIRPSSPVYFSSSDPVFFSEFPAFLMPSLKPNTMNKLVRVRRDSAPPCNQSTLDKEVP
jgi:hypothetical protein